jgi:NDP-sugar pyrophosphorylase family protein
MLPLAVAPLAVAVVAVWFFSYGTRLERDIRDSSSDGGKFAHLLGVPKPLVPIADQPLLSRWMKLLRAAGVVDPKDVFVVGNEYNNAMLRAWAEAEGAAAGDSNGGVPLENIINDGSTSNDNRLGAVRDIDLLLSSPAFQQRQQGEGEDQAWAGLLIVGGDTLFYPDFSVRSILDRFLSSGAGTDVSPLRSQLLYYEVSDTRKNGILEVDPSTGLVSSFLEKPLPSETSSRRACPCFYVLSRPALERVKPFVAQAQTLAEVDAPGNLLKHLIALNHAAGNLNLLPLEAQRIQGRFDIGGLETYVQCDQWFREFEAKQKQEQQEQQKGAESAKD